MTVAERERVIRTALENVQRVTAQAVEDLGEAGFPRMQAAFPKMRNACGVLLALSPAALEAIASNRQGGFSPGLSTDDTRQWGHLRPVEPGGRR